MTAFDVATRLLFGDPNLSVAASFVAAGAGAAVPVRVIRKRPDEVAAFGASRAVVQTLMIDVRTADLPLVERGDLFVIEGAAWTVTEAPRRDRENLVWHISLNPVS